MFATLLGAYPAATEPMSDDELVRWVIADLPLDDANDDQPT